MQYDRVSWNRLFFQVAGHSVSADYAGLVDADDNVVHVNVFAFGWPS
jgi:hypothetical protein